MLKNEIFNSIKFIVPPFDDKSIEEFINKCCVELNLPLISFENYNPFLFFIVIYNNSLVPVGFLQGSCIYERIEIEQLFILREYRGFGYGNVLLTSLVEHSKKMDCSTISLEVSVKNVVAINLYKKFDFEVVALRKNYYNNGEDAYLMVKKVLVNSDYEK